MPRDLCFTPATELSRLYRSRKVSPLEVLRAVLERLDRVNPRVNAIVTLDREAALRQARRATATLARRSATLGPLHGIPVGIKGRPGPSCSARPIRRNSPLGRTL